MPLLAQTFAGAWVRRLGLGDLFSVPAELRRGAQASAGFLLGILSSQVERPSGVAVEISENSLAPLSQE